MKPILKSVLAVGLLLTGLSGTALLFAKPASAFCIGVCPGWRRPWVRVGVPVGRVYEPYPVVEPPIYRPDAAWVPGHFEPGHWDRNGDFIRGHWVPGHYV